MLIFLHIAALHTSAVSLEKAQRDLSGGELAKARKQFSSLIRKGTAHDGSARLTAEIAQAYLGLAESYFLEKDFHAVIRSLTPIQDRIPDSKTGNKMRLLLFKSAQAARNDEVSLRQYQALAFSRRDFSLDEVEEHLRILNRLQMPPGQGKKLDEYLSNLGKSSGTQDTKSLTPPENARQELFLLAESLMSIDIFEGAERIWTALSTNNSDDIGRTATLRLGQVLDAKGDWKEAGRVLKLFVILFSEDPRAADALYRLGKWSVNLGVEDPLRAYQLAAEYFPGTLYGILAKIDMAWTWPTADHVQAAIGAVRQSKGLPDAVFERGVALALEYPELLKNESDLAGAARVYRATLPTGPYANKAAGVMEKK